MKLDINSSSNSLFFHLLSAAIWDKPLDANLFKDLDVNLWREIDTMAKRQAVGALIANKALSLPKESLPPKALMLHYIALVQQTEAKNNHMIKVLGNLAKEYNQQNLPFCILKGLSVGVNYPSPLLRNSGDIDLYIYQEGDYQKSKQWLQEKQYNVIQSSHIHYQYKKDDVWIENHNRFTLFHNRKYDKRLQKWEKELIQSGKFTSITIDGITVQQLPVEMNALFIFQHMFSHFIELGVGFRQYSDWLLFLSTHKDTINAASFTKLANKFALLYPMQVFARAAVKYLDAPTHIFPFEMIQDNRHVDLIIEDILYSGNFGFHRPGKQKPKQKLQGMWFSYKTTIQRSVKFGSLSPQHIRLLPLTKLMNRLKNGN